jgi:hypothetical protein
MDECENCERLGDECIKNCELRNELSHSENAFPSALDKICRKLLAEWRICRNSHKHIKPADPQANIPRGDE